MLPWEMFKFGKSETPFPLAFGVNLRQSKHLETCILIGTINTNLDRYVRIQTVVRTQTTPGHSELGCASSRDHSAENHRTLT